MNLGHKYSSKSWLCSCGDEFQKNSKLTGPGHVYDSTAILLHSNSSKMGCTKIFTKSRIFTLFIISGLYCSIFQFFSFQIVVQIIFSSKFLCLLVSLHTSDLNLSYQLFSSLAIIRGHPDFVV